MSIADKRLIEKVLAEVEELLNSGNVRYIDVTFDCNYKYGKPDDMWDKFEKELKKAKIKYRWKSVGWPKSMVEYGYYVFRVNNPTKVKKLKKAILKHLFPYIEPNTLHMDIYVRQGIRRTGEKTKKRRKGKR